MIGLYLYASGAQRQAISVMSTLGLSESYTNLVTRNIRRKKQILPDSQDNGNNTLLETAVAPVERTGTLHQLSESMRTVSRGVAEKGTFQEVYDNINMDDRSAEQIIGRHGVY